jgi:hypothetical protein
MVCVPSDSKNDSKTRFTFSGFNRVGVTEKKGREFIADVNERLSPQQFRLAINDKSFDLRKQETSDLLVGAILSVQQLSSKTGIYGGYLGAALHMMKKYPRRDSNSQPTDSKSGALSIKLRGRVNSVSIVLVNIYSKLRLD